MLIPPRRLTQWTTIPGTETTYAGVVPLVVNRGLFEAGTASVVVAYPMSERSDPRQQGVRLDFSWVVQIRFTSFWGTDPAEAADIGAADRIFALNVLDESALASEFLAGYSDPESWEPVFGDHRPEQVIRHFHVAFDDFGSYDVLAADCAARKFPLSPREQIPWDPNASPAQSAAEQARREVLLLADAMALDPLPPIVSSPFEQSSTEQPPNGA